MPKISASRKEYPLKTLHEIEISLRRLQKDHANVPSEDKDAYPEVKAITDALAFLRSAKTPKELVDRVNAKRQEAKSKAKQPQQDQAYQRELCNWYGIILADCGVNVEDEAW